MSSNTGLQRLTKKKVDELSMILKVDPKSLKRANAANTAKAATRSQSSSSGPDTHVIRSIQNRINNPLFSLTIDDYELMCGNKIITKMMSKVLECEEKQLKKFCKYINVFKENINSSPKSIKNKMKPKMTLNKLPYDLKIQIIEQYKTIFKIKYVLRDWIPIEKLDWPRLSSNPNAIELLKANSDKIDWLWLSSNPNAMELLKENYENIDWKQLSKNTNPEAIELLRENPKNINWMRLSSNPSAIELLKKTPEKIDWRELSRNINAIELLEGNLGKINWIALSINPNNRAIELLKANPKKIDWIQLSKNQAAIKLLKENLNDIDWYALSRNSNLEAIELLKANPEKIYWNWLSENPNAVELLKERIAEENEMDEEYLKNLPSNKKLNWKELSKNPAIFEEVLE